MIEKKITRLLVGLVAATMLSLLFVGTASALLARPVKYSFGANGTNGTTIGQPAGIAFQQSTKKVYVTGTSPTAGIYGFDNTTPGTFTPLAGFSPKTTQASPGGFPGIGVDEATGNVYMSTENNSHLYGYDSAGANLAGYGVGGIDPAIKPGAPTGQPTDICGGAVDGEGHPWIANYSTKNLLEYDSSGNFVKAVSTAGIPGGFSGQPCQMVFDKSTEDIYFQNYANAVFKLSAPAYNPATALKIDPYAGGPTSPFAIAVNSTTHHVFVTHFNNIVEYEANGTKVGQFGNTLNAEFRGIAVNDATDEVFVGDSSNAKVRVFGTPAVVPDLTNSGATNVKRTEFDANGAVDLAGGPQATECKIEWAKQEQFGTGFVPYTTANSSNCSNSLPITSNEALTGHVTGLTSQTRYQYRFKVANENGFNFSSNQEFTTNKAVTNVQTLDPTNVELEGATLNGSMEREAIPTNYYFQYTYNYSDFQQEPQYNTVEVTAVPPGPLAGSDSVTVTIPNGLKHGKTYYYRLVATNEFGTTFGPNKTFYTSAEPTLYDGKTFVSDVNTDQATINLTANPNGLLTTYHVEWGTEGDCETNTCESGSTINFGAGVDDGTNAFLLQGLEPGTTYYYRIVMSNTKGTVTNTSTHTFTTFAHTTLPAPCPNSLARQQTGAALLLDCRAFELVSAANTGGYDVESSLVPGQTPFGGYPVASSKVLYGIHNGAIPGIPGSPTNKGVDPYIATRGDKGWNTRYVGIPADGTPSVAPFSSHVLAADPLLDTFAFGGSDDLCDPCFPDGSSGIPMRLPDGSLAQGMHGESDPHSAPDGLVTKVFSDDGSHFVFGSVEPYELDGNNNGDVSIYDRNLSTGITQVVSKSPAGNNLACLLGAGTCHAPAHSNGIAELDISSDGSRIVVGQLISEDAAGNDYYHLYMHIGSNSHTVDLTPGTVAGAHFAGMTSDGSAVYFTTRDALTTPTKQDTDTSVDLFRASVDGAGTMALSRVSTGSAPSGQGSGNYNGCDPTGESTSPEDWNTIPGGPTDCSVVAVGGGGGVASGDGTVYFVSPETLDGSGEANSPNLFVVRPGGSPAFVTTLASNANFPFAPKRHLVDYEISGFAIPSAAAIDHANGEYYVMDNAWRYPNFMEDEAHAFVQKFKANGELDQSFGVGGKIDGTTTPTGIFRQLGKISGNAAYAAPDSIAVDNTCKDQNLTGNACTSFDPSNGMLYVPDRGNNVVDKFDSNGNYVSQIDVEPILGTINTAVQGVDVNSNTGQVFVLTTGGSSGGGVLIFDNTMNNQYTGMAFAKNTIGSAAEIAIDSASNVYLVGAGEGRANFYRKYTAPTYTSFTNILIPGVSGIAYDRVTDHLFLDRENHVDEVTTAGTQVGPTFGEETLEESYGLDAYNERVIVSNKGPSHTEGKFTIFTEPRIPPDKRHDDALVIDSVSDGDTHHTKDFQITPNGDTAAFGSGVQITSYQPGGHEEIYRYDQPEGETVCVSCPTTNAAATGDASLAENGLNLINDGRIIFTATEPLVLRDTNGKADVYEWKDGDVQPISPGSDQFGSKLLTVSADGTDAYFFTHASLAPQDQNGNQAKIYDARENGGFFVVPPQPPCVASDECHGPGTQAVPTPNIGSYGGSPTEVAPGSGSIKCPKGKVKRHSRCVPRHHKKRHKRHSTGKRG